MFDVADKIEFLGKNCDLTIDNGYCEKMTIMGNPMRVRYVRTSPWEARMTFRPSYAVDEGGLEDMEEEVTVRGWDFEQLIDNAWKRYRVWVGNVAEMADAQR